MREVLCWTLVPANLCQGLLFEGVSLIYLPQKFTSLVDPSTEQRASSVLGPFPLSSDNMGTTPALVTLVQG